MQQELIHRLFHILRAIEQFAYFRQRQDSHHQRVVPHLLMILFRQGDVLHAAVRRARHVVHRPLCPALQPWQIGGVLRLLKAVRQSQERGHGIDVFGGRTFGKAVGKPAVDDVTHVAVTGLAVILPDAV
ncbi:hypothetical protein D3C72_752620 [compost metagenome]